MLHFETRVPVRFRDQDAMGHVNHAVYLTYMEFGRQEYWFALTGLRSVHAFDFIVGQVTCNYKSPAVIGETIVVKLGVTRLGGASFTMDYELTDEASGRLVAIASTELISYDYTRKRPKRIAQETRDAIEAFEQRLRRDQRV